MTIVLDRIVVDHFLWPAMPLGIPVLVALYGGKTDKSRRYRALSDCAANAIRCERRDLPDKDRDRDARRGLNCEDRWIAHSYTIVVTGATDAEILIRPLPRWPSAVFSCGMRCSPVRDSA